MLVLRGFLLVAAIAWGVVGPLVLAQGSPERFALFVGEVVSLVAPVLFVGVLLLALTCCNRRS